MTFRQWVETCFSDAGAVSFGRVMSFILSVYFMFMHGWYFHRTGALPDNSTWMTALAVMSAFYVATKVQGVVATMKSTEPETPTPEQGAK